MQTTNGVRPRAREIRVRVRDGHLRSPVDYAHDKIAAVLDHAPEPVLFTCIRLTGHGDPAAPRPVVAQVNLDLRGRKVRVCVAAATPHEAVDLLAAKLRRRLERLSPAGWRRRDAEPARPVPYVDRPPDTRKIIRHKSFTARALTIDEAAQQMDLMDYDFHLFTEEGSGQDALVYRAGPTGYRLAQVEPAPEWLSPYTVPLTTSPARAPLLSTKEAVERLNLIGLPFLFYLDGENLRGCVLYRRYDGHYGLITPG
jgi:ribosome-associated translation inhibitor RaiA